MPIPSYAYFDGIEGECEVQGREGSVEIIQMDHLVAIPVDIRDASATSARQHGGMKLVANIDKATPQLMQCVCTSKEIPTVKLEFYRLDKDGNQVLYYTITMNNVRVIGARTWFPNTNDPANGPFKDMMDYELRYDKIEWNYEKGNLSFADEWKVTSR